MEEIFVNVPEYVRRQTDFWIDMALRQPSFSSGLKMIKEYLDSCNTQEEKDYVIFAFQARMEHNENNND